MAEPFDSALAELRLRLPLAQTILILLGPSEPMQVQAGYGVDLDKVWTTAPVSLSVMKKVRESAEPILSAGSHQELTDSSSLILAGIRAVLCVPLRDLKRQVQGLIYADQRLQADPFERTDLFRMMQIARDLERSLERLAWTLPLHRPPAAPRPAALPAKPNASPPRPPLSMKLASRSRVIFLRSLSTMLSAGVSINRALALLGEQADEAELAQVSRRVLHSVEEGKPLSDSLARCGQSSFSEFIIRLIRVGERSGALERVLRDLAEHEERSRNLTMRLQSKLVYPLSIFACCLVLLVILPPLALRGSLRAITDLGQQTPWLTRVVVAVSSGLSSWWGMTALALLLLFIGRGIVALRSRPQGRLWLQQRLLRLYFVGKGLRLLAVTRFAISLTILIRAGVNLMVAVPSAASSCDDAVVESLVPQMMQALSEGAELSMALHESNFFPKAFIAVVIAGEQTGTLDRTLPWIAGMFELEMEAALERSCAALEPLMMLGMGVVAAVIALAVMLPLVQLVQSL